MSQSEEIQIDPRILKVLGVVIAGIVVVGIYMATQAAYFESGQWIYFGMMVAGIAAASTCIIFPRKEFMVGGVILVLLGLGLSWTKFDWRRDYIQSSAVNPFPYEQYISDYPSFEQHIMASMLGMGENWVGFAKDCHGAIQTKKPVPADCKSFVNIKNVYGIDMKSVLRRHFGKMKKTTNLIVKGRMKRKSQLQSCLGKKECATIPMLPAGVDADKISEESREHLETRRTFWEIVDNGAITPKVCNFIELCRDLGEMGALNPENPKI